MVLESSACCLINFVHVLGQISSLHGRGVLDLLNRCLPHIDKISGLNRV